MYSFTVDEILKAAEQDKYPNTNSQYIRYASKPGKFGFEEDNKSKIREACVIGEAFLNLGCVENGTDAANLSYALQEIKPDKGVITLKSQGWEAYFYDLSDFINTLNGQSGWRGKKRIPKLARKYFKKSLDTVVTF